MKKCIKALLVALCCFILLLAALALAEYSAPNGTIRSFQDAVWFASALLIPGAGKAVPVTQTGRFLSVIIFVYTIIFLIGIAATVISLFSSQIYPRFRLFFAREKKWFVFSEEDADSALLADELAVSSPDNLIVFLSSTKKLSKAKSIVRYRTDEDTIINTKIEKISDLAFFFMGADGMSNYNRGCTIASKGIRTYSITDFTTGFCPDNLHLLSRNECLSRSYWKNHPLLRSEKSVVIIGCEDLGSEILERALLTNVYEPSRVTSYHVFGTSFDFPSLHPEIIRALAGDNAEDDTLVFHTDKWIDCHSILSKADRIIVCHDDANENVNVYEKLKKWFPLRSRIHLYSPTKLPFLTSFGNREEIMCQQIIIQDEINRAATILNDIYNAHSPSPVPWNELSPFLKQSNIAAADHLIVKVRMLLNDDELLTLTKDNCLAAYKAYQATFAENRDLFQEVEHRRWIRFHQMYNWTYNPVRDNLLRHHPDIQPYNELPSAEQVKNAYSWDMLEPLGNQLQSSH